MAASMMAGVAMNTWSANVLVASTSNFSPIFNTTTSPSSAERYSLPQRNKKAQWPQTSNFKPNWDAAGAFCRLNLPVSLLQLGRFANEAYEDSCIHRRRGQNVLRQLPARQRAGRGAQTAGPRRRSAAAVHSHAHRRIERQRTGGTAERDQRLPGPASRVFPQDSSPAGPSVGRSE